MSIKNRLQLIQRNIDSVGGTVCIEVKAGEEETDEQVFRKKKAEYIRKGGNPNAKFVLISSNV